VNPAPQADPQDFYTHLRKHYDALFPLDRARPEFLLAQTPGRHAYLDLGCATGTLAESLALDFKRLEGWDLSEGFLEDARHRCRNLPQLVFEPRNLLEIGQAHDRYDLISCLGNTIVHLENQESIGKFLVQARRKLTGNGVLVLQTVNYDALPTEPHTFPPMERGDLRFERSYAPREDGRIDFTTTLTSPDGRTESVTALLPLKQEMLESLAKQSGYSHIAFRGSFDRRAWSTKAPATIAVLRK